MEPKGKAGGYCETQKKKVLQINVIYINYFKKNCHSDDPQFVQRCQIMEMSYTKSKWKLPTYIYSKRFARIQRKI